MNHRPSTHGYVQRARPGKIFYAREEFSIRLHYLCSRNYNAHGHASGCTTIISARWMPTHRAPGNNGRARMSLLRPKPSECAFRHRESVLDMGRKARAITWRTCPQNLFGSGVPPQGSLRYAYRRWGGTGMSQDGQPHLWHLDTSRRMVPSDRLPARYRLSGLGFPPL